MEMSTTAKGNEFRDTIKQLVQLAGWRPDTERLVGGKKADLLFQRIQFGKRTTLAVEAKNYGTVLGQSELEKIVAGYFGAKETGDIDELWIVAPNDLKGGKEYIDHLRWIRFFTQRTLLAGLMDFSAYLNNIVLDYDSSGLGDYFINPLARFIDQPDRTFPLVDHLENWQTGSDRQPIAVVEGYGTGKTSIARHLSYRLANRYLVHADGRLPIYVELGRLTTQQNLNGLFSSLFTTDHLVGNFSYSLFRRMNQMGCFLVILDGFDEMKHLMSPADFEFNFRQLNELVEGNSRVILLGRPSAFSSDEERQYLLHGEKTLDGETTTDPTKPNFREVRLQPFTKNQVAEFVEKFLRFKARNVAPGQKPITGETIQKRLEEIKTHDYGDLLERPVQARMLAELAIGHAKPLGELTRFTLYKRFMDELISREMEKEARQQFASDIRRQFSQQLSWWMWTTNHALGVRLHEIPAEVFKPYSIAGVAADAVRRDLVSGSFLDAKEGDLFIVPHRSMIEFMVAEYLITEAEHGRIDVEFLKQSWTMLKPDVLSFILESQNEITLGAIIDGLEDFQGNLSNALIDQFATDQHFVHLVRSRPSSRWSLWHVQIASRALLMSAKQNATSAWAEMVQVIESYLGAHSREATALAGALLGLLPFTTVSDLEGDAVDAILTTLLRHADIARLKFGEDNKGRPQQIMLDTGDLAGKIIDALRRSISADKSSGSLLVILSPAQLAARVGNHLYPRYALADGPRPAGQTLTVTNISWPIPGLAERVRFPYNELRSDDVKTNWETLRGYLMSGPKVVTKQTA